MTDTEKALADAAWPYWEAEGEIARRFFAKATDEDHIFYLRAQLWKPETWQEKKKISFGKILAGKMGGDAKMAEQIDQFVEQDYQNDV